PLAAQAAEAWPTRTVRLVAVFPPGGSVDQVSRILAQQLSQQTGQQFVVENKGGAAGAIGTTAVAKSDPDGYTLGVVFDTHGVNPTLIPNLGYDTFKDLQSLVLLGTSAMAIVVNQKQPYKNFAELIAAAKAKPGSVSFGSIGTGSLGHLAMAQIGNQLGLDWTHVPYRGGGPLMTDIVAGHVPVAIGSVFLVTPHVKSGTVRPIGVTSSKPDPNLPGAEPVAQQGVAGFEAESWWGLIGPAKMPEPVVASIVAEFQKALKAPAVVEKLSAQGIVISGAGPKEFEAFERKEIQRWAKVVKDNNIKAGD
ncbi:MAG: tripartite tricarboxylate transporter substrate binding protein, partial [Burkholderiaceae bacterium]|nr:tripartite tricarboxylate transporter substrate binding protein [Burkholderiaceae bacterium]